MLLKKLLRAVLLCSILVFSSTVAFGAPFLVGDVVQFIDDQDYELLLRPDGSGSFITPTVDPNNPENTTIQVGDLFTGVIKFQLTELAPSGDPSIILADDTFTALFLIEATSVSSNGGPADGSINNSWDTLTFGAASTDTWKDVFGAGGYFDISSYIDVDDLDGSGTDVSVGTTTLFFDGVAFADADASITTSLPDSIASFVDGANLLYEFGFTGAGGTAATNEFWETVGLDAEFPALVGTNNPTNRLALNVVEYWNGPELIPHNYLGSVGDTNFTGETQLQGKGDFAAGPTGLWPLTTDTDIYIKPIPEPATVALFGLGLLCISAVSRKKTA